MYLSVLAEEVSQGTVIRTNPFIRLCSPGSNGPAAVGVCIGNPSSQWSSSVFPFTASGEIPQSFAMLSLGSSNHYYLYLDPTDMRKGADGLSGLVRQGMNRDPLSGEVFIFVNRRRDKMKLLVWDRTGFVVWYKRLEGGTFELPARGGQISWRKLVLILEGVCLDSVRQRKRYSPALKKGKKAA